jgi:hypothetical protein
MMAPTRGERRRNVSVRPPRIGSMGQPMTALGSVRANTTMANIMRGMGYEPDKELGKHKEGIPDPVEVIVRPKNLNLDSIKKPKPVVSAKAF